MEDNDVYRSSLELALGLRPGLEVVGAVADGVAALAACEEARPDVVLVDLRLPGLDGLDVIGALRRRCPGTAVVCLTGQASADEEEAARAAGAASVIRKGGPTDELVDAIVRAAGGRGATWS